MRTVKITLVVVLSMVWVNSIAQDWGTWIMYFGTTKLSDKISIHSEFQYRNHTLWANNAEQLLPRVGLNYHISPTAVVTLGYAYVPSYGDMDWFGTPSATEHRIFQQLILKNKVGRVGFEHRYRIEQRWVNSTYKNRFRYRVMATIPLNKPTMEEGTVFIGLYDEIFVNGTAVYFDRNRLYGAIGYKFIDPVSVQVGVLNQALSATDKWYAQVAIFYNPDLRK